MYSQHVINKNNNKKHSNATYDPRTKQLIIVVKQLSVVMIIIMQNEYYVK